MSEPYRVLVVDDEQLMRHALCAFFADADDVEVVGSASHGEQAVAMCDSLTPDVVLMDINMPVMGGVEATRQVTADHPDTRVIALTTFGGIDSIVPMLQAGACGYLLKDCDPDTLVEQVRRVAVEGAALSAPVVAALIEAVAPRRETPAALQAQAIRTGLVLSQGERDVLDLLAQGLSNAEMASELFIAEGTVKARLGTLCDKLGVDGRVKLLIRACELDLVRPRLRD